ncbi:MAG TPA: MATE family efflux transporter [Pseudonocardia sp.]|jgi:putative MATE family efflux protein|uniref:MATE family efflux transporter n=1 Tax=Pseudonocardia sp. TaxID=60912 RepID=UPI002B4B9138|nr:MATE family efflux transporter [Pseudonocardia sp.]HLU54690.1 MATE family efflux transporter [Pseudonocardia sp.]
MTTAPDRVPAREVLRLAAPALPVLAAEPLYLLVDTAVVGRLGAVALAGLAVAAVVFAQVTSQLNFLSYGTTSRAARLHGAGRHGDAVGEGVQATWLALAVGLLVLGVGQLVARPVAEALGDGGAIADAATSWLRVALWGAPMVLVTLAGNGWMRGVQDTVRPLRYVLAGNGLSAVLCPVLVHGLGGWGGLGLVGSALANVVGQSLGATLFLVALVRAARAGAVPLRPAPAVLRAQLALARDLLARSLAFQACFLSAAAVATRFGAASIAAHQIVLQLWFFQALVLDAVAIAAQALVGAALGSPDRGAQRARALAGQVTRYGLWLGIGFGVLFACLSGVLPPVFTPDAAVLAAVPVPWWFFTAMQPIAGVVFALDGVLLGAGDAAFLRTSTIIAAVLGFLPLIWASLAFGWGLAGIWSGLALFMVIRLVAVGLRARGDHWAVTGAVRS